MKLVLKQTLTEIMLIKNNQDNNSPQQIPQEILKKIDRAIFKKLLVY